MSLNRVCRRLKVCLWLVKWSLVSIAIEICSFTKRSELKISNTLNQKKRKIMQIKRKLKEKKM